MPFQPAPDVCRVIVHLDSTDVFWSNTFHFAQTGFTETEMQSLISYLNSDFISDFMAPFPSAVQCTGYTLYDMRTADGTRIVHTFGTPVDGGVVGGEPVSLIAAAVFTLYTAGRGPWNQGRLYIGGISETSADERRVQDAKMIEIENALEILVDTPPPGWLWVVVSRYLNGAQRAAAVHAPILSVVWRSNIWGRQSKRVKRP